MFWIFAATVTALAVYSPGFRKFLTYAGVFLAGAILTIYLIGLSIAGHP
jgi:hypothetical protein